MKPKILDQTFSGYIFEFDGTISNTLPLHFHAWTKAMNDFGVIFPEDLFYSWGGRPTTTILGLVNEKFGLSMAISSGGHYEMVDATLNALSITKMFQAIICAEGDVNGKPVPDLFLLEADRLGVAVPKCISLEGNSTCIEAAKVAGMAWGFAPSEKG